MEIVILKGGNYEKNTNRVYSWVRCRRLECSQNPLGNPISNGDD